MAVFPLPDAPESLWDDLYEMLENVAWDPLISLASQYNLANLTDLNGNTLLHLGVENDLISTMDLPAYCVDPNKLNNQGQSALSLSDNEIIKETICVRFLCIDFQSAERDPMSIDAFFKSIYEHDSDQLPEDVAFLASGAATSMGGWSALMCAAQFNRVGYIRALSQRFPHLNPNQRNARGDTALIIAAQHHNVEAINALFECFPRLDASLASKSGTALHFAARYGFVETMRTLFNNNVPLDMSLTASGESVLSLATMNNHVDCIELLFNTYPDMDPYVDGENYPTLFWAAQESHLEAIIALHKYCSSRLRCNDQCSTDGHTILMWAVLNNNPEMVRVLHRLFPDIDPDLQSMNGLTALHLAAALKSSDCIYALYECWPTLNCNILNAKCRSAIFPAVHHNRAENILALHECFPQVEHLTAPNDGCTPLILATSPECIRALHKCFPSLDVNQTDHGGYSVMTWVAQECQKECITALYECFPNLDPEIGPPPLMWTAENNDAECVRLFHRYWPHLDPNAESEDNTSALRLAIKNRSLDVLEALLECYPSCDLNMPSEDGVTPLMQAVETCQSSIVTLILEKGRNIDPTLVDANSNNILHWAVTGPEIIDIESFELLCSKFSASIDPNAQTLDGKTVLMLLASHFCVVHIAVFHRYFTTLQPDITLHINPHLQSNKGYTALDLVIVSNNNTNDSQSRIVTIQTLAKYFPTIDPNSNKSFSLLTRAAERNFSQELRTLQRCFPTLDPNFAQFALITAIKENHCDCIAAIVELYSNYININQLSSMHPGRHFVDQTNLAYGDENDANDLDEEDIEVVREVDYPFLVAARDGTPGVISLLLSLFPNIDVNVQDATGTSALMMVVEKSIPASYFIIQTHPQIQFDLCDKQGENVMFKPRLSSMITTLCHSFPTIDINHQRQDGATALMVAVSARLDIVSILTHFASELNLSVRNTAGQNVLYLAAVHADDDTSMENLTELLEFTANLV